MFQVTGDFTTFNLDSYGATFPSFILFQFSVINKNLIQLILYQLYQSVSLDDST